LEIWKFGKVLILVPKMELSRENSENYTLQDGDWKITGGSDVYSLEHLGNKVFT